MNPLDFANQHLNQAIATENADAGECTAIPHLWEQTNGWPVVYGNAIDTYGNAPAFYSKELNTPTGFPPVGAIIVFEANNKAIGTGQFGHTGLVVSADVNGFDCFEQNDEPVPLSHIQHRDYTGVYGWFYHSIPAPAPVQEVDVISADDVKNLYLVLLGRAASDDEANTWAGQSWHDAYYGIKDSPEGQAHGKALADQLTNLQAQVTTLQGQVDAFQSKNPLPIPVTNVVYKDRPVPADPSTLTAAQLWSALWRKLTQK